MTVTIGRRELLVALGGAATTWPLAGRAQQREKMRRIGVLMLYPENDPHFVEGQNVTIETSPPKFSASGGGRCRAAGSVAARLGASLSDAAGAHLLNPR